MGVLTRFLPSALLLFLSLKPFGCSSLAARQRPRLCWLARKPFILRHNPVTTAPTANFLSQGHIRQQAQEQLEALLAQQRFLGRKIMLAGDSDARYQRLNDIV